MQKGHQLQFDCVSCDQQVTFSIFQLDHSQGLTSCDSCKKKYLFDDEDLKRQLKKFEALCRQICESEEILSNTSIGIDVGDQHVKIPYKLLLTRLNSCIDLMVGDQPVSIRFRLEPTKDLPTKEQCKVEG